MHRFVRPRAISFGFAISAVALTHAQTYYSPDGLFASQDYFTPGDVAFAGDGGGGQVSFDDLRVTIGRVVLPLDSAVHQYAFDFDCATSWSFGASSPPEQGVGGGTMSMSLQFDGVSSTGAYAFSGQLNTLDCVCRAGKSHSIRVQEAAGLDSFVHFSLTPTFGSALSRSNTTSGGYLVDSSFDAYLTASVDGGQTWSPSVGSAHFQGTPEPASIAAMGFGLAALLRRRYR